MTNDILLTLDRAWRAMTINELAIQMGTNPRNVSVAMYSLYASMAVEIADDRPADGFQAPLWQLTSAGKHMAAQARAAERMEEATDDEA